jgi:hypothetical protein
VTEKRDLRLPPRPDLAQELGLNFSAQDIRLYHMTLGRRVNPSDSIRLSSDGNGGLLAVGRSPDAVAALLEKIHKAGRENRPIEVEFETVPWKGNLVATLALQDERELGVPALPPPSQSSNQSKDGK